MRLMILFLFAMPTVFAGAQEIRPLDGYRTMMWVSGSVWQKPEKVPLVLQRLKEMGVNTGMIAGDGDASAFVKAGMPYYVENIVGKGLCLKFNSPVTKWSEFVNGWMKSRDEASLVRPFCLDDPEWNAWAQKRMRDVLKLHKPNAPVLADIRDELSTTISANPFDYDLSPQSLAGFCVWLKTQYADLAALNREWETDFASWDDVKPFTTDQIKARMVTGERMPKSPPDWSKVKRVQFDPAEAAKNPTRWNFAPWCNFRSYMDTALARALSGIRNAAREVDAVPVGIEGTQMPNAFGGYDLWKLSQSVDWMEPYDVGCSREILGSFMPRAPFVTTVFEKDTEHAMRRLWHLLLLGDKGCVVWWSEDCVDLSKDDCPLTAKAKALAPVLKEMTSPLARLFMKAEREYDPIAIHYSQASIQVAWLMESAQDGATWPRRFSSYESQHSRHAAVRNGWLKYLQDNGYAPVFLSTEEIIDGALSKQNIETLVMPDSWCVSEKETEQINQWAILHQQKFVIRSTGLGGAFDGHGVLRNQEQRSSQGWLRWSSDWRQSMRSVDGLGSSGGSHFGFDNYLERRIEDASRPNDNSQHRLCIRTHRFHLGKTRLLAFERNVDYHMSEDLKQAGGNEALEKPVTFEAKLTGKVHVYDLRAKKYLGETDRIAVHLDPWRPSLFALLPEKLVEGVDVVEALAR